MAGSITIGAHTVYLAYLARFFKPVMDLAGTASAIAQTNVALERIQNVLDPDPMQLDRSRLNRSVPEVVPHGSKLGPLASACVACVCRIQCGWSYHSENSSAPLSK